VDSLSAVDLARALIDIDSTTGREAAVGEWLAGELSRRGYGVERQPVTAGRFNLFATLGRPPAVVLSTHYDCVPPFFPSRVSGGRLYGRGACDAKGILAAQVVAADRLRAEGRRNVALLFVVGEERGSDGAMAAAARAPGSRYLVNGEPTGNRLGAATKGALRLRLRAHGRAAHSSSPELGESAIEKLIDALVRLRALPLPDDPVLGRASYVVGTMAGGVAPNVVPPSADAEVMFRTVTDAADVRRRLEPLAALVDIENVLEVPPVRMRVVEGFETAVFAYTTDVPFLASWGEPLLYGPGSIEQAHTADEQIAIAELERGVEGYVRLVAELLDGGPCAAAM
jgi:acetylornithine deacetylase